MPIEGPSRQKRRKVRRVNERKELCTRCYNLVAKIRAAEIKSELGHRIARIDEKHDKLQSSACEFCRLLATIKCRALDDKRCELRAYSANRTFARVRRPVIQRHEEFTDTVALGIVTADGRKSGPKGFIGVVEPELSSCTVGPRKIRADQIDFALLRSWLSFCQTKHKGFCRPSIVSSIESLKVIDCLTEEVVKAPQNCHYVALSYVWGSAVPPLVSDSAAGSRSTLFPKVVQDSITAVRELGYKYLWVDKYCIDQDDATEKHDQIKGMHLVYGNAELTLIAAAGEDSNYGLPGVGSRHREEQQHITFDNVSFIRTFPHASQTLAASTWAKRGWTYQEGHLSKRKLVFTAQQVAFQCNGMHCSEAVSWPYELMHAKAGKTLMAMNVPEPPFRLNTESLRNNDSIEKQLNSLLRYIEEYSKKSLSYQSDGLNAFLGILGLFAEERYKIYHLWGMPITTYQPLFKYECIGGLPLPKWAIRFDWFHPEPCSRRVGFPTWTWTGWAGPVSWREKNFKWLRGSYSRTGNLFQVAIESDEGKVSLHRFGMQQAKYGDLSTRSRFLSLKASVITLPFKFVRFSEGDMEGYRFLHPDSKRKDGLYAEFSTHRGTILSYFYADDRELDLKSLHGRALPAFIVQNIVESALIVLVQRHDHFERVGFLIAPPDRDLTDMEPRTLPEEDFILDFKEDGTTVTEATGGGGLDWQDRLVEVEFRLG